MWKKENHLSGILNTYNKTEKAFTTKLSRFYYLFMLVLFGEDIEIYSGPRTRYQTCNSRGCKIVHQNVRGIPSNQHLFESFVNKKESKMMLFAYLKLILRTVMFVTKVGCILCLVIYFYSEIEMLVPVGVLEHF